MKKYLIFRTDRVGDFIVTCILINNIKKNYPDSQINVVCSQKNFDFINNFKLVDKAFLYPDNFLKRIYLYFFLLKKKFNCILSLDGKKRSIFFNLLLRSELKIFSVTKKIYKTLLSTFNNNIFLMDDYNFRIDEFKKILAILNLKFEDKNLNIFNKQEISTKNNFLNKIKSKSFILIHLDEKWFSDTYKGRRGERNFEPINPNKEKFLDFLKEIIKKTNLDLVVSSGKDKSCLIKELEENTPQTFLGTKFIQPTNNKIFFLNNLNFNDLILTIKKAKLIITCHGSPSHIASSFDVNIIDIFDEKNKNFYKFWTQHLRNYKYLYRESFTNLSKKIIELI